MTSINMGSNEVDDFLELFDVSHLESSPLYDGSKLILKFQSDLPKIQIKIEKVFNEVNLLLGDSIEIKLSSSKINHVSFFYGGKDFIQKYEQIKNDFNLKTLIVLDSSGNHTIKKQNEDYSEKNKLIHNLHEYHQTLDYFIGTPEFTPYVSDVDNQFTLISKTHGVFNIGYKLPDTTFFQGLNLENLFIRFKQEFDKKEFIQFFKEIVITGIHNTPEESRFNEIVKEHNGLLNLAQRDYETYVSNFAFDKIKSEFKEEREKYFDTIDKNISSIGKQVISFPLTFGATIFASYKVKDQPEFLFLILIAYFLYTVIAYLILNMTAYNVQCLRKDVDAEESIIKKSYGIIHEGFKSDFKKIKNKITNLRVIIGVLYFVLTVLLILFAAFTFYYVDLSDLSRIWQESKEN